MSSGPRFLFLHFRRLMASSRLHTDSDSFLNSISWLYSSPSFPRASRMVVEFAYSFPVNFSSLQFLSHLDQLDRLPGEPSLRHKRFL